ncbi:MAG: hypothetical protein HKP34_02580 [Nitrosopumilus sp.]|nr:hypothetical protein [Nitrosopumilus sp.]NNL37174.1 hypothetical protein [Nitrosopumilus sp.]
MKKRGLYILVFGVISVTLSLTIATTSIPTNVTGPENFSMATMFEGMFDEITNEIQISPGELAYVSYDVSSNSAPLLWGIQISDYVSGDKLSINISNIFGDSYGQFVMSDPILFEALELSQSDNLNFEIKNTGSRTVSIVVMFSEDPENSDALANPDSPLMNMVVPLLVSGFLLVIGIIISIIGVIVILVDLKNNLDNKKNY